MLELNLGSIEADTCARTQRECPDGVGIAEHALSHLNDGLNRMPSEWDVPDVRDGLILQLVVLGYDSLRWALETSVRGYYLQSYALVRQAWEAWLNAAYLHLFRDRDIERWQNFRTRPRPAAMRKAVAEASRADGAVNPKFLDAMNELADTYAGFSHPSEQSVRLTLGKRDGELWLRRGGEFDLRHFLDVVNHFALTAYLLSTMMLLLLPEHEEYGTCVEQFDAELSDWRAAPLGRGDEEESTGGGPVA